MLQALSPEQVQDVISLVNDLRAKNQAREKSGEEPSIEDILYSPERQKLAAYLLNLSVAARTELIALMLLGRGDEFKSYSTALAHSLKYKKECRRPGSLHIWQDNAASQVPHRWSRVRAAKIASCLPSRRAENADMAMVRLEEFEAEWGRRYPAIGQIWRRAWEHVVPFFAFAPGIRKMIYTTNAVEALNRSLRKIIKTRGSFPNDDAALKLLYLAIRNAGMRWRRSTEWTAAMGQFAIQFGARFPGSAR